MCEWLCWEPRDGACLSLPSLASERHNGWCCLCTASRTATQPDTPAHLPPTTDAAPGCLGSHTTCTFAPYHVGVPVLLLGMLRRCVPRLLSCPCRWAFRVSMPTKARVLLVEALADLEHRLAFGTHERLQLGALCAAFVPAREAIAQAAQ